MRLTTFFVSKTKQIYAKTLVVPQITFKIRAMLPWIIFEILLTSAVICKQIFLHENEIVQYLQNYKYQDIIPDHFRKPYKLLQIPCKTTALPQPIHFSRAVKPKPIHFFNFKQIFGFKLL